MKIAITGGIGSGKSTVAKILSERGYKVVSCDEIYTRLLKNKEFLQIICGAFGDILNPCGELDRAKLSEKVFKDNAALEKLNKITHKAIMEEALKECENSDLCFCEVPLLFEGGYEILFDNVIVVIRDEEERIKAVSRRDNVTAENVKLRIVRQFNYDMADFEKYYVLHNNGSLSELEQKTLKIVEDLVVK